MPPRLSKFFYSTIVVFGLFFCGHPGITQAGVAPHMRKSSANPIMFVKASPIGRAVAPSMTMSFATLPVIGNTVVVSFWGWRSGTTGFSFPANSVTDNQGNTYSPAVTYLVNDATNSFFVAIYYAQVVASAGTFTVTAAPTGAAAIVGGAVEYLGILSASPIDRTQTNSATSAAASSGATLQTTKGNELLVAVLNIGATCNPCTISPQGTFSPRLTEFDGATYQAGQIVDNLVSTTGTYSHNWTVTSGIWASTIATFKAR